MKFNDFTGMTISRINKLIHAISHGASCDTTTSILYPTHALFTMTNDHYAVELIGASNSPKPLKSKNRKAKTITGIFELFQHDSNGIAGISFEKSFDNNISGLCMATDTAMGAADRFPIFDTYSPKFSIIGGDGPMFRFDKSSHNIRISNTLIASSNGSAIRCKHVSFFYVIRRDTKIEEFSDLLNHAIYTAFPDGSFEAYVVLNGLGSTINAIESAQLKSLILSNGIHETTIGDYIHSNPQVIKKFFKTSRYEYEPHLHWLEGQDAINNGAINPDLMIDRGDGYYDIVDLKLARTDRKKLTKGQRSRRRFTDYVYEGISQLKNYEYYFSFEKNSKLAYDKYGIKVDAPRLYLISGTSENVDAGEVREALRSHGDSRITLVDYDTLAKSFFL